MAKKKKIIKEQTSEPVTNCDQSLEPVANCDQLPVEVVHYDLKNADIESLIRTIRGQKVMVDFDLAMLYGGILKSQNSASSLGGTRKLPYAFTREGIGMLSSVLGLLK